MLNPSKRNLLIIILIWLCIPGIFLIWMEINTRHEEKNLAHGTARAFFQQIAISRLWNASHGGVYVPATSTTPPNEYLNPNEQTVTTTEGIKLTKINPSYMTRQLADQSKKDKKNIQFHLTSLNTIRPENKAAEWEKKWLISFEQGVEEQGEFFNDGEINWYRYMAPLITVPECLTCHSEQGYELDEIRGGLSVSIPYPTHAHIHLFVGYGAVVTIGLIFITIAFSFYEKKKRLFDATFNSPVPTCVTDKNFMILMANESYWSEFGALPDAQRKIKCYDHRPGETCHTENCPLTRIMNGASTYAHEAIKEKDGVCRYFIVTSKPLLDGRNKFFGIVESFQDISVRKQTEKALEESNKKLESLSNTDGLTKLSNRRHFNDTLTQEYARHLRTGRELSLIILDIDFFKQFNDYYGHVTGDECLQQVAGLIGETVNRNADLAARYGGEEFAIILPETDREGAITIAEKIRQGIFDLAIPHRTSEIAEYVTASLGVVTATCTSYGSYKNFITQADELLYRAKTAGRNQVKFITSEDIDENGHTGLVDLVWKDSYSCGNQLIDSQHRSLFHISNILLEALLSQHPKSEIYTIINRLFSDITRHFNDEEMILNLTDFPDIAKHAEEHAMLIEKGRKLIDEFEASNLNPGKVFQFLAYEIIKRHMLEADREFFPFIK